MKILTTTFLILTILTSTTFAEGPWHVNSRVYTNVNAMQKGREVTVSGRVSSGSVCNPLQITLYVQNDEGKTYRVGAMVSNYVGKGELFQARFIAWERAKWWKIVAIESN
jgi:hypothetical protein